MPSSQTIFKANPGLMFTLSFVLVAIVNMVVIHFVNMWFPGNVVLGTMSLTRTWALVLSSSVLSMLTVLVMPFLTQQELLQKRDFNPMEMIAIYLVLNFVFVWLLTRASEVFGLGVSSWLVVLALAAVMDFAQGMVMMQVEKLRKGK